MGAEQNLLKRGLNIIKANVHETEEAAIRKAAKQGAKDAEKIERAEAKAEKVRQAAETRRAAAEDTVARNKGFDDAEQMKTYDHDLYESEMAKLSNASEEMKEAKKAGSGLGKPTVGGAAIGAITGAGIGGVTGLATGADEDDMKSMIVMGALAGGTAGAITGGVSKAIRNNKATGNFFKDSNALDVAADAATGKANHAIKDGAKGVFGKVGASVQSFSNKIDDIGENISHNVTNNAVTKEFGYDINEVRDVIRNDLVDEAIENAAGKANILGGAAEGAIMGSTTGAVIGGISGAVDEDDTFVSGALRGGLIGGTLGGIGGGASGYFNKSGKVLSNTTNNLKSLVGGN